MMAKMFRLLEGLFGFFGLVVAVLVAVNLGAAYYSVEFQSEQWRVKDEIHSQLVWPSTQEGQTLLTELYGPEMGASIAEAHRVAPNFSQHPTLHYITAPTQSEHYYVGVEGVRYFPGQSDAGVQDALRNAPKTVFMFGGSTTFGHGSLSAFTLPAAAQGILSPTGWTVFNFGSQAYDQTREIEKLVFLLKEGYRPDVVLFLDGLNDIIGTARSNYRPNAKLIYHGWATGRGDISRGDRAYRFGSTLTWSDYLNMLSDAMPVTRLQRQLESEPLGLSTIPVMASDFQDPLRPDHAEYLFFNWAEYGTANLDFLKGQLVQHYERNLAFLDGLSDSFGFEYKVFYQPIGYISHHNPWVRAAARETSGYRYFVEMDAHIRTAIANGLGIIDLSSVLGELDTSGRAYVDVAHYSPMANEVLADQMIRRVESFR